MISNSFSYSCTQRVRVTEKFELSTTFYISKLSRKIIVIEKIDKMVFFVVHCLKCYLLLLYNQIIFFFLVKVPWQFTWDISNIVELFSLFINNQMMNSFGTAGTILEDDRVVRVFNKKDSKILKDCDGL